MTKKFEIYKCEVCGNIVEVLHAEQGDLVCCGKPMVLMSEKTQDPEKGEKHLPVIKDNKVIIGEIEHPMTEEHYIEWIEAADDKNNKCKVFLSPNNKPEAEFPFSVKSAREYCNLHGLWKK
jgi:superoxide reductase